MTLRPGHSALCRANIIGESEDSCNCGYWAAKTRQPSNVTTTYTVYAEDGEHEQEGLGIAHALSLFQLAHPTLFVAAIVDNSMDPGLVLDTYERVVLSDPPPHEPVPHHSDDGTCALCGMDNGNEIHFGQVER